MSVNVRRLVVDPGDDTYVDPAWDLKERIRDAEGVLRQRKSFFTNAYKRSRVFCYLDRGGDEERLIGFAAVRRDGYILFLAVDEAYRGEGFGKRLVANAADEYDAITCHARTTNRDALRFYRHLGFNVQRRVDAYYEDGGDAYYLKLGEDRGIRQRLADLLAR